MSYDVLIWLRRPPNPEHLGHFLTERGFDLDQDAWWKDWSENDAVSFRRTEDGFRFYCFFGPVQDTISSEYTALGMISFGLLEYRSHLRRAYALARDFATEFGGRVRNPQSGRWVT